MRLRLAFLALPLLLLACSGSSGGDGDGEGAGGAGATGGDAGPGSGAAPGAGSGGGGGAGGSDASGTGGEGTGGTPTLGAALCPAPDDVGYDLGQQLPSLEVFDCDGNAVSLDAFCGADALWIFAAHGWCPLCQSVGSKAEALHDGFAGQGLVSVQVVVQGPDYEAPDAGYCQTWRDVNGLEDVITLFDPAGVLLPLWSASSSLSAFVSADRRIVSKLEHDSNIEHIEAGIEGALAE